MKSIFPTKCGQVIVLLIFVKLNIDSMILVTCVIFSVSLCSSLFFCLMILGKKVSAKVGQTTKRKGVKKGERLANDRKVENLYNQSKSCLLLRFNSKWGHNFPTRQCLTALFMKKTQYIHTSLLLLL